MLQWCEFPAWKENKFEYWSFEAPLGICWALLTSQIDVSLNCVSHWITWGNHLLTLDVSAVQPLENALSVSLFLCLSVCASLKCAHICPFVLGSIIFYLFFFCCCLFAKVTFILPHYIWTLQNGYDIHREAKFFLLI